MNAGIGDGIIEALREDAAREQAAAAEALVLDAQGHLDEDADTDTVLLITPRTPHLIALPRTPTMARSLI